MLLIVCVVAVVSLPIFQFVPSAKANPDWLSGWSYRKSHVINNATGAGTNYQMNITVVNGTGTDSGSIVYINNKTRSDFGDVRFTDNDEVTLLDCWIESLYTGINATFFFEVADDLSTVAVTIYVYYGKADATTTSNGANTFLFFDDFNRADGNLDDANWDGYGDLAWTIVSNEVNRPDSSAPGTFRAELALVGSLGNQSNIAVRCTLKVTAFSGTDEQIGIVVRSNTLTGTGQRGYLLLWHEVITQLQLLNAQVAWGGNVTKSGHALNEYWRLELTVEGNNIRAKAWEIGADEPSAYDLTWAVTTQSTGLVGLYTYEDVSNYRNAAGKYEDFVARKFVYPEPSHGAWGSEDCVSLIGVSVTSVHTCPLDEHTFVIVYHDETHDCFSFRIYDTNGTQILAETDVDTTSGGTMSHTSIGVSAFNSTTFVIGWYDGTDQDATFAVYNTAGTKLSGPTDADTDAGVASYSVQVSCFNSTHFVIGWVDLTDFDVTFAVYNSAGTLIAGPIDADMMVGVVSYSVSVSAFNSTTFVIGWYDSSDYDATFAVYNSAGTQIGSTIDADTDVGSTSCSVSVSTLNSTHFVIGWFDQTDQDVTFAVYNSAGTLKTGPTDADTEVGVDSCSVQVSALNSTAFVISWYDYVDFDLSYATYLSDGTAIAGLTDIESWPTAANDPFKYQSPCSQETANNIKIFGDNWIIAYANTTDQAIWKAFYPNGTAWDGTINNAPTIGAVSGTNWDDTDNCYAQKKTYTVSVTYSDADGFPDIRYCELYLKTGGNTTRAEFAFLEDTSTWSIPAGSTQWTLTGYSNSSSGNNIAVVWGFQAQWDATEESDLDFLFFVNDTAGASVNSLSDQNFDVVTRLVTSGFTNDDSRINVVGTTTISGTVYYGNAPGSNTASTSYPPDAEFTSISVHGSAHASQATDNVVVNGYFEVSFAIPNAVQSNTYHVYINVADADGTDQDALDGDTTIVAGDRFKVNVATLAFEDPDGRVNVGTAGIFSCTVESELDGHVLGAGDSLVLTSYTFTYNGTYWVNSTTPAVPTSVTINSLTSVNEATFGITVGNVNANSATGKWDRIRIDSLACVDTRIDISTEGLFYCTATLETDGHALGAGDSLTLTGHVFAWNVTSVRFEYKETNASATNTTINSFTSGNEANFGITIGNINTMTATEAWDRYKIDAASLTFSDLDGRTNVGVVEVFSCTAQSENDGHVLGSVGDTLTLSGYAFSYNGTYWVYSTSLAAPADLTINALTSVYEATYAIGAGNINGNSAVGIWDNLTVTNIQPVQYLGSGDYKYEAQLKYGYDLALISGGYVDLAYPNGTIVGQVSSNATGWVTFIVGQLNSTSGTFTLYGENETSYSITYPGANQTFTIYLWTLTPQDVSGNTLTNTDHNMTLGATVVWNGTATAVYVPPDTFNVTVTWLQNLAVNSTINVVIAGDTTTNLNCTCYPYVIGATRYWAASNATITSVAYAGSLLTVQFSCALDSYVLVASYTTYPAYVLNVTYNMTIVFASGYLVMPHFGNMTIVASYENWAGLYVKYTDRTMWSVGWAGYQLTIVTNGAVGDSGELYVYCASRGSPVATSGFTVINPYIGGVFSGLYAFTDTSATVSLEWAFPVGPESGPGPIQAASLFVTLAFTFPETVQSGATVDGFLNVSWIGAAKVYIWSVVVDSDYAKDWELQIARLPWTLETLSQNGLAQVPVVLYITGALAAGHYSVPCDVTFNTVEGVSKTVRTILTFEVVTPIAQVPSTLVYVFLIGIGLVVTSGLFLGTQKRRKYSH